MAARSEDDANDALKPIGMEYEQLPFVVDVDVVLSLSGSSP